MTTTSPPTIRGDRTDSRPDEDLTPTVQELELAWRAVRAGQFRRPQRPELAARDTVEGRRTEEFSGPTGRGQVRLPEPVVVVAGAHGWAGTSTTVLLLAEAAARRGEPARVIDSACPAQSGFVGAAITEHGVDETGQWRIGSRGPVNLQRLAHPTFAAPTVPPPMQAPDGTVSIVDASRPLHDLLKRLVLHDDPAQLAAGSRTWLQAALISGPLVLTARACVPGLRHLEQALASLEGGRAPGVPVVIALLGPRTLSRALTAAAGARVRAALEAGRLVTVPERPALTQAGLTPAALPRELQTPAQHLLTLTCPPRTSPTDSTQPTGTAQTPGGATDVPGQPGLTPIHRLTGRAIRPFTRTDPSVINRKDEL